MGSLCHRQTSGCGIFVVVLFCVLKGSRDEGSHRKPRAGKIPIVLLATRKGGLLDFMSLILARPYFKEFQEGDNNNIGNNT